MADAYKLEPHPDAKTVHYYDRRRLMLTFQNPDSNVPEFTWQDVIDVPTTPDDIFFEVTQTCHRLDLIAFKFYRTPRLWWLLALANKIFYPWKPLEIGTIIRVPSLEKLDAKGFFNNPVVKSLMLKPEWE